RDRGKARDVPNTGDRPNPVTGGFTNGLTGEFTNGFTGPIIELNGRAGDVRTAPEPVPNPPRCCASSEAGAARNTTRPAIRMTVASRNILVPFLSKIIILL